MFSFKRFIVLLLNFRSLIHFELIFGYSMRQRSNFILLCMAIQLSKHHLFSQSILSSLNDLGTLVQKSIDSRSIKVYFWTLNFSPLIYMSVIPHCLCYRSFVVSFKIGKFECSNFVLFQDPLPLLTGHPTVLQYPLKTHSLFCYWTRVSAKYTVKSLIHVWPHWFFFT